MRATAFLAALTDTALSSIMHSRVTMKRWLALTILLAGALFTTTAAANTTALFTLPSGVAVRIVEAPFKASQFKIQGCSDHDSGCRINGRVPAGVASGLPKTYVKSIRVSFGGQSYFLDASDMYNAWNNRPLEVPGAIRYFGGKCFNRKNCQFRGLFSDAGGAFLAEWLIVNGVSVRTVLTGSNDVVNLFMQNIDPPDFD